MDIGTPAANEESRPIWLDERHATTLRDTRKIPRKIFDWFIVNPTKPSCMPNTPLIEPKLGRVGICCSGGGVRSAAYNLGALQVLREEDVLKEAQYLSAVSGGS